MAVAGLQHFSHSNVDGGYTRSPGIKGIGNRPGKSPEVVGPLVGSMYLVNTQPTKAGIDPLIKLIDRHPDDNVKPAEAIEPNS